MGRQIEVETQVPWGWGHESKDRTLSDQLWNGLRQLLAVDSLPDFADHVDPASVNLPAGRIDESVVKLLQDAVGSDSILSDAESRLSRSGGKSYLDLVSHRNGDYKPPDLVVRPTDSKQIQRLLELCNDQAIAVVPFGGGTSVVGGVRPDPQGFKGVVAVDMALMTGLIEFDRESQLATFAAGTRLADAEDALLNHGFRLAHYPQSFEWATVGGCVATRSAGQASTGFGRIEDNVRSVSCITPMGELSTLLTPATATGPSIQSLIIGSEGMLGVIDRVTLEVHPVPEYQRYEGWLLYSFSDGKAALRELAQSGISPDIVRLSDEVESDIAMLQSPPKGRKDQLGRKFIQSRGFTNPVILIAGWEGEREQIRSRQHAVRSILRRHDAFPIGTKPGRAWLASRYDAPYIRDELLRRKVLVETLETATTWNNLDHIYDAVRSALVQSLGGSGFDPVVMCHISHIYASGASLYFTVFGLQSDKLVEQWNSAKTAATEAVVLAGGTITHHHAIGLDHAKWLVSEHGGLGIDLLRVVKERCDPSGIMNPGKLLPKQWR